MGSKRYVGWYASNIHMELTYVSPANGEIPLTATYVITPTDHISVDDVTIPDNTISGATKSGIPRSQYTGSFWGKQEWISQS